ncbi:MULTISPECIES: MFS transporter [Micromonospora]|uniref:MFS transporter n=1 Tax=Micromonospora solifontis TaxID=2487138 RepID=A0ABX9WH68_9ACTN|nr:MULTISPECIES: MFS transporter [Micromonospora]NES15984.1 MFS transporter [Micromonospora sp. PPF5-17B]NES36595.1 MFS transporter [Micromonospora solifontis]NES57345.1 MFS transporter [Micromonospora sp. PPF5-6]RNL99333.1 MFS transporter [Micromonospora solifontis]
MTVTSAALWRHATFRRLWLSDAVSTLGTHVTTVALPLAALTVLGANATGVAALTAATTLPYLLLGLPAGAIVDRLPRRAVLVTTDLVRAVLLASVPLAWAAGRLTLAHLVTVALLAGCATVLFDVAYFAAVPAVVPAGRLAAANARLEATRAVGQTAGPGLAGVLVGVLGAPVALLVDVLSFVASALFLAGTPRLARSASAGAVGVWRDAAAGVRFVFRDPVVRALTLCSGLTNLWHAGFLAMLLVYAVRELRLPAATVGLLVAGANVGYLLGAAVAGRARARLGVGRAVTGAAVLQAGAALVLLPHPLGVGAGLAVNAFASGLYNVNAVSLRQAATPPALLSRMTATSRFVIWGAMPLGAALGGALTGLLGAPAYLALASLGMAAAALVTRCSPVWRSRDFPSPPDLPATPDATTPAPAAC